MGKKISCVVAYPSATESGSPTKFDMNHYLTVHMPMIDKYWIPHGMKSWSIAEFPASSPLDGSTPPYIVQTTILWDSVDDLKAALSAPTAAETRDDIPKFTDVFPVLWVSEIVESKDI